jgi:hypothetical protein
MAARATFALKDGVWFRRGLLLIVSPDSPGTTVPAVRQKLHVVSIVGACAIAVDTQIFLHALSIPEPLASYLRSQL